MNSYYRGFDTSRTIAAGLVICNMATVIVSFRADARVYQEAIERDMEFHEQHGQLRGLQIMVDDEPPAPIFIDLTGDDDFLDDWHGDGSAANPYCLDDGPICVICQDPLRPQRRTLPCAHTYCQVCIRNWFKERQGRSHQGRCVFKGCPTCKNPFQRSDVY